MKGRQDMHGMLRGDGERHHQVAAMELFFDLVYVFAITQVSHFLLSHFDARGAWQAVILLLAIWWAWVDTAWLTNWFDPDRRPVRIMLAAVMVPILIMATTLPKAFGERGLLFAITFVSAQVGKFAFAVLGTRDHPALRRNFERILSWRAASGVLWLAGGLTAGDARVILWTAAVTIDSLGPILGFRTPALGRSLTHDWHISAGHMAERCKLFLIIALGESILIIGATFGELDVNRVTLAAFVVAFLGSVALWWVYFDRGFDAAVRAFAAADDPGRVGMIAYTYIHILMVAGIILTAAGDELVIANPLDHTSTETLVAVLVGPALFLAGHLLFKWAVLGHWSLTRVAGIAVLGAIALIGQSWSPLALATSALLVVIAVVAWDVYRLPGDAAWSEIGDIGS
jgi:low temperature requirement protein LtrA